MSLYHDSNSCVHMLYTSLQNSLINALSSTNDDIRNLYIHMVTLSEPTHIIGSLMGHVYIREIYQRKIS